MRKFNLKATVVQRMKGIPREEPKSAEPEKESTQEIPAVVFSEEQGIFACAFRTDVGRLRKNNQDALILGNGMAGVADGMGGHKGGEIASAGLRDGLLRETEGTSPSREKLTEAVQAVNLELWNRQNENPDLSGMGTTLTILWPAKEEIIIGQVGDSRAYLLRDGALIQVTNDHSMVADMVRKGVLTEEQAACHPMRNYITRAVGTEDTIEMDLMAHDRKKGDRWLVCSDGLYSMISRGRLQECLETENIEEAADSLLQAALAAGGSDNISLVILQDDTESAEPGATPEAAEEPEEAGLTEKGDHSSAGNPEEEVPAQ